LRCRKGIQALGNGRNCGYLEPDHKEWLLCHSEVPVKRIAPKAWHGEEDWADEGRCSRFAPKGVIAINLT
jgi:hypothetical protein